ncbi:hypothetical protein AB0J52_07800 [Spirillospora sp. NPDC049652]
MRYAAALAAGSAIAFFGTLVVLIITALNSDPDLDPGVAAGVMSWVSGTLIRALGGYVAGLVNIRSGSARRVVTGAALAGGIGYAALLILLSGLAVAGGAGEFSLGDLLGFVLWPVQAALGGGLAAILHRRRISRAAAAAERASSWAYG